MLPTIFLLYCQTQVLHFLSLLLSTYRTQRFTIIFLAQKETSKQTNLALLLRCTQTQKKLGKKLSRLEKLLSSSWHLFFKVNIRVHGQSVSIRYLKLPNNSFQFFLS